MSLQKYNMVATQMAQSLGGRVEVGMCPQPDGQWYSVEDIEPLIQAALVCIEDPDRPVGMLVDALRKLGVLDGPA